MRNGARLYLITKLQNLKAIHNTQSDAKDCRAVVSNYKITKSESYSQLLRRVALCANGCI